MDLKGKSVQDMRCLLNLLQIENRFILKSNFGMQDN